MPGSYAGMFVVVRGPLAGLTAGFEELVWGLGYSARTVEAQLRMARDFSGWLEDHAVAMSGIDADVVDAYVSERRARTQTLRSSRGLVPLLGFLGDLGVVPVLEAALLGEGPGRLMADFEAHLLVERALSPATARSYCSQVRPLVWSVDGEGWGSVTADRLRRFVDERAATQKPRSVKVRISALRALLRWLWRERRIAVPLHDQLLSMYAPSGPPPPRGLTAVEVAALKASLSADPLARLRDTALLAVMVRLGLRAGEAAALRLEDLNWRAGTVTVTGKRRRVDQLPLPVDVGEALVAYLRRGRPVGTGHRQVFLAVDAPHGPIGAVAVTSMVGRAMRLAGIAGPGAAHRLRHTAAMGVIAGGGGLVEADQLLRHSTISATAIYARADIAGLAVLARPWPGAWS